MYECTSSFRQKYNPSQKPSLSFFHRLCQFFKSLTNPIFIGQLLSHFELGNFPPSKTIYYLQK
jgi:hypothetical protein